MRQRSGGYAAEGLEFQPSAVFLPPAICEWEECVQRMLERESSCVLRPGEYMRVVSFW
jgi:hypothetical protein